MTATFQCPHCEASYPLLPTLYGRTVRCSTCKQAFRLRGDGIAEKVVGKKTTKINKPERSEAEKEELTKAFISKSKEERQRKPPTKRLQKKQENSKSLSDLRKSMSSALNAAASEAIAVEERKQEQPLQKNASQRKAKTDRFLKATSAPVLTGEGQRQRKQALGVSVFCLACIALIGGCVFLIEPSTPQELALQAYTTTTDQYNNPKKRLYTYLERNALFSYDGSSKPTVIVNVDRAIIDETVEYELTKPCLVIQTKLTGLTDYPQYALWAPANSGDIIEELWLKHQNDATPDQFHQALKEKNINYSSYLNILNELETVSQTPFISFMLSALLCGTTDYKGNKKWADKLLAGDTPSHCIISTFHGEDGQEFQIIGSKNSFRTVPSYSGSLVKFIGNHWDDQWRIFTCHPTGIKPRNPLLAKYRSFTSGMLERYQQNQTNVIPDGEFVPDSEAGSPE